MLFTTKVTEVIGRSIYDPRKIHGVMIEAASKRIQGSPISRFQHLEQQQQQQKTIFKEEKGEYIVYIIIMQREKQILSQCNQILSKVNEDQSYISSGA